MTPIEYILDLRDVFIPELFLEENAAKLTKLKGILQFSDILFMGCSVWDNNMDRHDKFIIDRVGISSYKAYLGLTKLHGRIGNFNTFITNAEFRQFTSPPSAAIWVFSIPRGERLFPELTTFSIFEVY